jgi:hypothetical protein
VFNQFHGTIAALYQNIALTDFDDLAWFEVGRRRIVDYGMPDFYGFAFMIAVGAGVGACQ